MTARDHATTIQTNQPRLIIIKMAYLLSNHGVH